MKEIHVRVTGRVQMVMFRDFSQRHARSRSIVGTVQNLKDGSVEIIAQGNEPILLEYIKKLNRGSFLANVQGVEVVWRSPSASFSDFSIIY